MRFLTLAILGLLLAVSPADAAAPRNSAGASAKVSKPASVRTQVAPRQQAAARSQTARRPQTARRSQASRRPQAVVHRSASVRGQVGVTRDARAASASTAIAPRRAIHRGTAGTRPQTVRWMHGLSAAANVQARECPDGTMATLAHGHDNITRCMPL